MFPDGYVHITDRKKDIIVSGGENISSIEIENALYHHSAVSVVAVVAMPDIKWGEVPCAFVELKSGTSVTKDELIVHCRTLLASYKVPQVIYFCEIPKTVTGKSIKWRYARDCSLDEILFILCLISGCKSLPEFRKEMPVRQKQVGD